MGELDFDDSEDESQFDQQLSAMMQPSKFPDEKGSKQPKKLLLKGGESKKFPCRDMMLGYKCRKAEEGELCRYSHDLDDLLSGWSKEVDNLSRSIFNPKHNAHHMVLSRPLENGSWFPKVGGHSIGYGEHMDALFSAIFEDAEV